MAMPCDAGSASVPPAYIVYRDLQPGEPIDPTVPPTFFPPKDSDELFDALRAKYPHLKTHSERMRDAIIEFLLDERQNGQYPTSAGLSLDPAPPPSYASAGSHSHSSSSVLSSPEMMNFSTPAYYDHSPMQPAPSSQPYAIRQPSISTSSGQPSPPPSLDQMTTVFSLSTGPQPKQRVRRKMTEAEKIEYRKRRIVKACDKCARRKRKCHHNQPEMDSVGHPHPSTLGHKVAKSFASASSAKSSSTTTPPMSQRETESFLGHAFVDAAALDPCPELPDLPEWAFDDGLFDDELLYPTLDVDEFLREDIFLPELACLPPMPAPMAPAPPAATPGVPAWAGVELPGASGDNDPVLRALPDLGRRRVTPDARANGVADQVIDDRAARKRERSSIMKGRTARWKWRQESGPLAGGKSSRTRRGSSRAVSSGDGLLWKQPREDQHEVPDPSPHWEPCTEPCPDMGSESDGYGSSTSSDQDAIYEALPLDWQRVPGASRAAPGPDSTSRRVSGATGVRGLSSTSVTVPGGASSSTAPEGRPASALVRNTDAISTCRGGREPIPTAKPLQETPTSSLLDSVDPKMEIFRLRRRLHSTTVPGVPTRPSLLSTRAAANPRLAVIPDALAIHAFSLPRQVPAGGLSELLISSSSSSSISASTRTETQIHTGLAISQDRLSDHVRYKDHHGRPEPAGTASFSSFTSLVLLAISAGVLAWLLFAAPLSSPSSSSAYSSVSWLLLAALTVLPASAERTPHWGNEVQCTLANSSWLAQSMFGKHGTGSSGGKKSLGSMNTPGIGKWLKGLMYPFELAPMHFS